MKEMRWVGDDLVDVVEEAHKILSYEKISKLCNVNSNTLWQLLHRHGACTLITADRILDALGYKLVIVKKEDDT